MKSFTLYTKPIPLNQKFFICHGRNILSTKYRDTKEAIHWETVSSWKDKPLAGEIKLTLKLFFGDLRKRDIDAYVKIVLDAMEGVVYENDNQIVELHLYKTVDKSDPRIEVVVE